MIIFAKEVHYYVKRAKNKKFLPREKFNHKRLWKNGQQTTNKTD